MIPEKPSRRLILETDFSVFWWGTCITKQVAMSVTKTVVNASSIWKFSHVHVRNDLNAILNMKYVRLSYRIIRLGMVWWGWSKPSSIEWDSHKFSYRNDPKFSDRYAWSNSADPNQTTRSSLIRIYTVCHSVCIFWTHYSMVEPHSSNIRGCPNIKEIYGISFTFEPLYDKTCLREFPSRPDTNRPAQPQRLARVLKFRLWNLEILYYPSSEQQRRWSDCADAQADLRLCCSHMT